MVSLVSGTVSGFARTLGHYISFGVTVTMMIVVNIFIANGIKYRFGTCCQKYGPFILTMIAAPLICADLTRHVLNDLNIWPWCGDPSAQYGLFPRVNVSWSADCLLSSTQFVCTIPCCVPGNNSAPKDWPYGNAKDGMYRDICNMKFIVSSQCFKELTPLFFFGLGMLPPYWPEYPQLSNKTLEWIEKEAIEGGNPPDQVEECNCLNCVPLEDENIYNLSPIGILFTIIFTYTGFTLLAIGTMWNANIIKKCGELREKWNELRGGRSASVNNYRTPLVAGDGNAV